MEKHQKQKLVITVAGRHMAGKTTAARLIEEMMKTLGANVTVTDMDPPPPKLTEEWAKRAALVMKDREVTIQVVQTNRGIDLTKGQNK